MNNWKQKLETLLRGALNLLSPEQRDGYLRRVGQNDVALREALEELLRVAEPPGRASETGAPAASSEVSLQDAPRTGAPGSPAHPAPAAEAAACPPAQLPADFIERTTPLQTGGGDRIPTFDS